MDVENVKTNDSLTKMDVDKFIILYIITFGLYGLWWIYKSWHFFKAKENTDIMPAMRALFSIFFLIPLFNKILKLAHEKGYDQNYTPILLYVGYIILTILGELPPPYFLFAFLSIFCLIPPFKALNYAIDHCTNFNVNIQNKFNSRQIFLLVIGGILWFLILVGLFAELLIE